MITSLLMELPGQEIDVGSFDKLRRLDAQLRHEFMGLADSGLRRFAVVQDDLKLKELPEVFDTVQVNPSPANQKQCASLPNAAGLAIGKRQSVPQSIGRGSPREEIEGLLGTWLIGAAVKDELAGIAGEGAQFQAARFTGEERVVLLEFKGTLIGDGRRFAGNGPQIRDGGFDLDVSWHGRLTRINSRDGCGETGFFRGLPVGLRLEAGFPWLHYISPGPVL